MNTDWEKLIDREIGRRLMALRRMRKMSQEELASKVGITYQQVQKYEKGRNRIATSRLCTFSRVLGVLPLYFFGGLNGLKCPGCQCIQMASSFVRDKTCNSGPGGI